MATGVSVHAAGIFSAKPAGLLSIAFDSSHTDCMLRGRDGTFGGALAAGVTVEEIMELLRLYVVQGVHACNFGRPILDEEIARRRGSSGVAHEQ